MESKILASLKDLYQKIQPLIDSLNKAFTESKLVRTDIFTDTIELLHQITEVQSSTAFAELQSMLELKAGQSFDQVDSLIREQHQLAQKHSLLLQARAVFTHFMQLRAADAQQASALNKIQTYLADLTDEQIMEMDYPQDVQHFQDFVNLVDCDDRAKITQGVTSLLGKFDQALLLGLMMRFIHREPITTNTGKKAEENQQAEDSEPVSDPSQDNVDYKAVDAARSSSPALEKRSEPPTAQPVVTGSRKQTGADSGEFKLPSGPVSNSVFEKFQEKLNRMVEKGKDLDFRSFPMLTGSKPHPHNQMHAGADAARDQTNIASDLFEKEEGKKSNQGIRDSIDEAEKPLKPEENQDIHSPLTTADSISPPPSGTESRIETFSSIELEHSEKPLICGDNTEPLKPSPLSDKSEHPDKTESKVEDVANLVLDTSPALDNMRETKPDHLTSVKHERTLSFHANASGREIAEKMLLSNIKPDNKGDFLFLVDTLLKEGRVEISDDNIINTPFQALFLLKSLSSYSSSAYNQEYHRLLLAMDAPFDEHTYEGNNLPALFSGDWERSGYHLAAMLRALFAPSTPYDWSLHSHATALKNSYDDLFPEYECIKPLFILLMQEISPTSAAPGGFSPALVGRLVDKSKEQADLELLKSQAVKLKRVPVFNSKINAIVPMRELCFGRESDLYQCMEIIENSRLDQWEIVALVYDQYVKQKPGQVRTHSMSVVETLVDDKFWPEALKKQSGPRKLNNIVRSSVLNEFENRLNLMKEWLDATEQSTQDKGVFETMNALRGQLLSLIEKIQPQIDLISASSGRELVRWQLDRLKARLDGGAISGSLGPCDLLRTGYVSFNNARMPVVEAEMNLIDYFEPWRNSLRHIAHKEESLSQAWERIFDKKSQHTYENYGQATHIRDVLLKLGAPGFDNRSFESDIPRAVKKAEVEVNNFKGRLEVAFAHGQISEIEKERLLEQLDEYSEVFFSHQDYGRLMAFLDALEEKVQDRSKLKLASLKKEILDRREKNEVPDLMYQLDEAQKKLGEAQQKFSVAEEYINRYDMRISEKLISDMPEGESYFQSFLSEEVFDTFLKLCRNNESRSIKHFGGSYLENSGLSSQYVGSGKRLLNSLPNRPQEATTQDVVNLLEEMGFKAKRADKVKQDSRENVIRFKAQVDPDSKDKAEYAHPVSQMGTKLESPLDVIFLFGKKQANDIVETICKLELSRIAVVFLNGALDQVARRQIAEYFHNLKSGQNPFLLVDWVLLMHLATIPKNERFPIFLSCTLPYSSSYRPFVTSGSVPDEMFIGRKRELNELLSPNGPVIVYGGRQLGKTALLERAQSRAQMPDHKQYAVLIRETKIYDNETMFTSDVVEKLTEAGLKIEPASSLKELCDQLRKMHRNKVWKRITLLIDESDHILSVFRKTDPAYKPLSSLNNLKRETGHDFKFVFAGLHNVCRVANEPNSIFGQFGKPLAITPLSQPDALELLLKPLGFLGFLIKPEELENLLVSTNYYPGIVHYVGYSIVENLSTRYRDYYQATKGHPPYTLNANQLRDIMNENALNDSINDKFRKTLEVDSRYYMLACCVAYLYYDEPEKIKDGFSMEDIALCADLLEVRNLKDCSRQELKNLLDEMVEMGVLASLSDSGSYKLRQMRFRDTIGHSARDIERDIQDADQEQLHV